MTVLFEHQKDFIDAIAADPFPQRACVFFKTGAGKSLTAVMGLQTLGYDHALVIAPPSTHAQWKTLGLRFGMEFELMSHAKFRMPTTKVSKSKAVIADEFHLFGGQKGQGWKKLDALARHLQAPLFIMSATPQYNDAERCYCVQHILDPVSCKGGFLQFLYQNCITEQNPFSQTPNVTGFLRYPSAIDYLAALPRVHYLADDLIYQIEDKSYGVTVDHALTTYGYNRRDQRMVASGIEMTHTIRLQGLIANNQRIYFHIWSMIEQLILTRKKVLIFAQHSTVIDVLEKTVAARKISYDVVTGATSTARKTAAINNFILGKCSVLLGTASLATGTDGLDKVCDTLLILDDTEDDALRRQLIGRIMPRGESVDASMKQVIRLVPRIS